jgi:hypothetical protein
MSIEVRVFLRDDRLPTHGEWQREINERGVDLVLEEFSTRDQVGFVPAKLHGEDCGFEYLYCPKDELDDDEELQAAYGDRDRVALFKWHSSDVDGAAAVEAACVLAAITNGIFFECSSGEFAVGSDAYQLIADESAVEAERCMREAERRWGKTTERRCPKCNAPCPEYRAHCYVCKFELGRIPIPSSNDIRSQPERGVRSGGAKRWWQFWK